jgi:hypothetical protein
LMGVPVRSLTSLICDSEQAEVRARAILPHPSLLARPSPLRPVFCASPRPAAHLPHESAPLPPLPRLHTSPLQPPRPCK